MDVRPGAATATASRPRTASITRSVRLSRGGARHTARLHLGLALDSGTIAARWRRWCPCAGREGWTKGVRGLSFVEGDRTMPHQIVSRDEWLAARKALLA